MEIMGLELNCYLPIGLNEQRLLLLAVKNSKCIPIGKSFWNFISSWDFSGI